MIGLSFSIKLFPSKISLNLPPELEHYIATFCQSLKSLKVFGCLQYSHILPGVQDIRLLEANFISGFSVAFKGHR